MSPQCRTNRSMASGSFAGFSVVSVMTEISEIAEWKSSAKRAAGLTDSVGWAARAFTASAREDGRLRPYVFDGLWAHANQCACAVPTRKSATLKDQDAWARRARARL